MSRRPARARRSKVQTSAALPRCVLDSGGVTALVGPSQRARAWLLWIAEHDGAIDVPVAVVVEIITGDAGRDAEVNRVLDVLARSGAGLSRPDEMTARRAGALRFRARSDDGVDALVAAAAIGDDTPCVLLTSDPDDLSRLLVRHANVEVVRV